MSRLIVKNLPKSVSEEKLRKLFSQKGSITDLQLKYKDGKFRQFCFIGYENEECAQKAAEFFNDTFVGTSKIKVEFCSALGDKPQPKPWSKYSKLDETLNKNSTQKDQESNENDLNNEILGAQAKKSSKIESIISNYKDDPQFQEFMKAHAKDKLVWENDLNLLSKKEDDEPKDSNESHNEKLANKEISDSDYMKHLMGENEEISEEKSKNLLKLFTIKVRNIPKKIKREEIKKFFRPSKAHSVRIPRNSNFCYVGFKLERDMRRALGKDKSFLKGKQIHVYEFTHQQQNDIRSDKGEQRSNPRWQEQEEKLKGEETICDSGKLFFRNLPYNISEDDVQKVFEKYGNIVEVNVPIDSVTRKIKGFGTVTFLMPENAVQAYSELNGSLFHGRMLHILPGKANDKNNSEDDETTNYKEKKRKELKKTASSAHNWNTLFLGANVVAELISKTYGKSKEEVLESATGGSGAAVRLALGETQVVLEMKKFLESHGVKLESFDDDKVKRSKTVIIAKNLPSGTEIEELREKFAHFGVLEKIVLPPSGVTCLIKFSDPSEARKAFKKLAYSKFKHLPLYLEWAPENVFSGSKENLENNSEENKHDKEINQNCNEKPQENIEQFEKKIEENEDDFILPEDNTTLFIKNLSLETTEEKIKDTFKHIGMIHTIQIAKKKSTDSTKTWSPLGYGFIQFKKASCADKALKTMQMIAIDGKNIELKRSDRTLKMPPTVRHKNVKNKDQNDSTKIMVRNIPFQANANEIRQIFQTFGELKAVRLPRKTGVDQHRGFGFIDFVNKSDARSAFLALHLSTHLYGRRLVLEWAETEEDVSEIRKRTAESAILADGKIKRSKKALMKEEDFIKLESNNDDFEDE